MIKRMLVSFLTATIVSLPVRAENVGLQIIPKWHMAGGEACYVYEDARKLISLDLKLQLCVKVDEQVLSLQNLINTQAEEIRASQATALAQDQHVALLQSQVAELNHQVIDLPWLVAGGAVILVLGVALGAWVAH